MNTRAALIAAAAVFALAGCGGGHPAANAPPTPTTSAAAATPAGCGQAVIIVGTVRGELGNAPTNATFLQASRQLAALGKSLPEGELRLQVDKANFELTQYWERLTAGEAGGKWARMFAADLQKIDTMCGS